MVKSETRRDAETLDRNPSPRLFGKKFQDSKKVKTNHAKTRPVTISREHGIMAHIPCWLSQSEL